IAQAACSRDEPEPKFLPPTRILPRYVGSFSTKSALGVLSGLYRQSRNRLSPKPTRSVAFKNRAGMIWSVSTFSMGSGTAVLVNILKLSYAILLLNKGPWIGYSSGYSGRSGHQRTGQQGACTRALTASKIPVRRAHRILARRNLVVVHRKAGRATGLPQREAGLGKDIEDAFLPDLLFHYVRAGDQPYRHIIGFALTFH